MSFKSALVAASLALLATGTAQAALVVSSSVGGAPNAAGVVRDNLDWLTLGSGGGVSPHTGMTLSFSGNAQAVQGSSSTYAPPFLSGGNGAGFGSPNQANGPDATTYISAGSAGAVGGSAVTMLLSGDYLYFGLLWGSVDDYNTLSFYDGAMFVGSITGAQVLGSPTGNQGVNGTVYVNIVSDMVFDRVVATSSQFAFEFDNIALSRSNPIPEPGLLALLGLGLAGVAVARRRRA